MSFSDLFSGSSMRGHHDSLQSSHPWQPVSFSMTEAQEAHMKAGNPLFSYGLVWRDTPTSETSVSLGYFTSQEEGERQFASALKSSGYTKPKWWQYWRWNENRPSETVLEILDGSRGTSMTRLHRQAAVCALAILVIAPVLYWMGWL